MDSQIKLTELVKAHSSPPPGMMFYSSFASVQRDTTILGYVSVIERAWNELNLDGVLCLDSRPILYLKEYSRPFSPDERIIFQRRFWNQGVANVLVLADPISVYIYSGLARPPKDQSQDENALVETLSPVDYMLRIQSFYHDLATGHYYESKQEKFDPRHSVDSWLLDNLRALRNSLIEGDKRLETKDAHAFIGRILFLCYLLDRGIYSVGESKQEQTGTMVLAQKLENLTHKERIKYLYDELFCDLKERFNGNMFDQDLYAEKALIRSYHLTNLISFLGGHNVKSGQRTLGFWAYDFKMIPVETISAIYQDFLATEDREMQQQRGAFYTPRFLAEMVVDIAIRDNPDAFNWSFLDPACGSGIFLVILFNRLANNWISKQNKRVRYDTKAKALQEVLAHQIRGVDVEETACRIACFSLYLAYLDFFDPPDIRQYMERTGESLPRLLNYGDSPNRPKAEIPVIMKADFLSEETFSKEAFDCIIGNPPWEGRQSKQLALKFMQKAPSFLRKGGLGTLLLPSKILQNQTNTFQADWLQKVTLERVLQLADYRFLLFQNALCPAIIARFRNEPPDVARHNIEFAAPKFNRDGLRQGIITVNPSVRTWIPLANVLTASKLRTAPIVWKSHLWGTPRDRKFLNFLQSLPRLSDLTGNPNEGKRLMKGMGFQPYYSGKTGKPLLNPFDLDIPFVGTDDYYQLFVFPSDCIRLGTRLSKIGASKEHLRRAPDKKLFKAPLVLLNKGFSKVAYCDFDVIYQDSLRSISGSNKDAELLMFLTAYLQSKLAKYFMFHTSANWGTERNQIHLDEVLRIPFILPEESVSPKAEQIVRQVVTKMNKLRDKLEKIRVKLEKNARIQHLFNEGDFDINEQWQQQRKIHIDALQNTLEQLIYSYFGLTKQEIMLVEDTVHVFEPSSTPTAWRSEKIITLNSVEHAAIEPYARRGLKAYANTLTTALNEWAQKEGSRYRLSAQGLTDEQTGLAIITLNISNKKTPYQHKSISVGHMEILKKFHSHAAMRKGSLIYERDILIFKQNEIFIVRPNILMNWTHTAALNDATRIYRDIALSQRDYDGN